MSTYYARSVYNNIGLQSAVHGINIDRRSVTCTLGGGVLASQ